MDDLVIKHTRNTNNFKAISNLEREAVTNILNKAYKQTISSKPDNQDFSEFSRSSCEIKINYSESNKNYEIIHNLPNNTLAYDLIRRTKNGFILEKNKANLSSNGNILEEDICFDPLRGEEISWGYMDHEEGLGSEHENF